MSTVYVSVDICQEIGEMAGIWCNVWKYDIHRASVEVENPRPS